MGPLHERMETYDRLADEARAAARERDETATEIGEQLADAITETVEQEGANVVQSGHSRDGHRFRFTARLDRAALVAALNDSLPDGFVVSHVNDDGSMSVEWTGSGRTPSRRARGAVLKAIVAEEMEIDDDGLIESVPTKAHVLARAVELGLDEAEAKERLSRLETLEVVEIADGRVYPDDSFSRY